MESFAILKHIFELQLSNTTTFWNFAGSSGISSGTIVAIVVPISVATLLLIVGLCFLSKRVWKKKPDSAQDPKSKGTG
jgi:FtsH-binding integral membrane protein